MLHTNGCKVFATELFVVLPLLVDMLCLAFRADQHFSIGFLDIAFLLDIWEFHDTVIMTTDSETYNSVQALFAVGELCREGLITNQGKGFLKELILKGDSGVFECLCKLGTRDNAVDADSLSEVHEIILKEGEAIFNRLFRNCSLEHAKMISRSERQENNLTTDTNLIYGEVDYANFVHILRKLKVSPGGTFYDLGSGTGRALLVARMNMDFDKCIGVEILEGLYGESVEIIQRYNRSVRGLLSAEGGTEVETHLGSLLEFDWSDATVCFANSTCFGDRLMEELSEQAARLRPGAYFVTFTKPLAGKAFTVLDRQTYDMSWGAATVFVQRRVACEREGGGVESGEGMGVGAAPRPPSIETGRSHAFLAGGVSGGLLPPVPPPGGQGGGVGMLPSPTASPMPTGGGSVPSSPRDAALLHRKMLRGRGQHGEGAEGAAALPINSDSPTHSHSPSPSRSPCSARSPLSLSPARVSPSARERERERVATAGSSGSAQSPTSQVMLANSYRRWSKEKGSVQQPTQTEMPSPSPSPLASGWAESPNSHRLVQEQQKQAHFHPGAEDAAGNGVGSVAVSSPHDSALLHRKSLRRDAASPPRIDQLDLDGC